MKKLLYALLAGMTLTCTEVVADPDVDVEDLSNQQIQEESPGGPFSVEISGDYIGRAKFKCHEFHDFTFGTANIDLSFVYYYNPCFKEAATVGLVYTRTRLGWNCNPFFTQKDYDMVTVNLGGYTERVDDWIWRAQVSINFDNIEHWTLEDYMSYDLLLWGRYACTNNFGIHLGFLALTGMKIDRVYPVIGIDWTYDCHWKLSLVFPMDIAVVYNINYEWSVALAGRFFNQRHRVKKDQFFSEGLWFYTSSGAEFAVNYHPAKWLQANLHAGVDFGGHLKVANRHYRHGHRLRFDSAPYGGAELSLNF